MILGGNQDQSVSLKRSKPNGIVHAAGAGITAAGTKTITADEILDLEHSVDPAYRSDPSCRYMFTDATLKIIRKLKDGQGRYIWQPADMKGGAPSILNNYPYSINQHMPEATTGNKSILFGAFNRYVVRIVNQFTIRRLVERYADFDQTGFLGFSRLDGQLLDAGAVKALTQA
jgi:HK97 family phage major capsid protein